MAGPARIETDLVVVGAGAAGLYAALTAAGTGARVALVSATPLARTASYWAQGGLAAALAADDSPDLHREDTERAGRNLVRTSAATVLCREAPRTVGDLERLGVHFDADRHGNLALGLEGGHSRRRVVHAGGSATGRRVVRQLSAVVVETAGLTVIEGARAATLWVRDGRCVGVVCEDGRAIHARAVILATGGSAALWQRTTNPPGSLGIGLLLAPRRRRGARRPRAHAVPPDRGDRHQGPRGLPGHRGDPRRGRHAPRRRRRALRRGARAARRGGARDLVEDGRERAAERRPRHARGRPGAVPQRRRARCARPASIRRPSSCPVAPAAHYGMGGVVADLDGATTVPGLYAVGESACTGLHGANRLASNSLSECFVFGARAALAALSRAARRGGRAAGRAGRSSSPAARPARRCGATPASCATPRGSSALAEDPHPLARLIARHALLRAESRGAHTRSDRPQTDPALDLHHSVTRGDADEPAFERWV